MTITQDPRSDAPPIDPRLRERRVAVQREEGRRRLRVVVGVALVAALTAVAVGVSRSPVFDLDRLVVTGATRTPTADVARAGGLRHGTLLVDLDLVEAARAIESLPWVAKANVSRQWPGTVAVAVVERVPAAAVETESGWAQIAVDGHVLTHGPERPPSVPEVVGIEAPGPPGTLIPVASRPAIAVAAALAPTVRDRVAVIEATPAGEVDLVLSTPRARVRLGSTDRLDAKLLAVETVLAKVSATRLSVLDVRAPETPVVTRDP